MDKHNVRLTLRRHIDIEARLIAHLLSLKPRRHHVKVRVGELLALGLTHKPPAADVDENADPAAKAMELYVPLARPADASVLDALAARPEHHRNDWLRARLLAGFAASQAASAQLNAPASGPSPVVASASSASLASASWSPKAPSVAMVSPASRDVETPAASVPSASSEPLDFDLSEPVVVAPSDGFAEQRAEWEVVLQARDAANDWAEGERDAHMAARPMRNELRGLLG